MILTKHDWAQLRHAPAPQPSETKPSNRKPFARKPKARMLDNPEYVADLTSGMKQREIAEKWRLCQSVVSRHQLKMREGEV